MTRTLERRVTASGLRHGDLMVLAVLATGATEQATARQLGLSDRTVRRRMRRVCDQIGVDTTIQAITWAAKCGLV